MKHLHKYLTEDDIVLVTNRQIVLSIGPGTEYLRSKWGYYNFVFTNGKSETRSLYEYNPNFYLFVYINVETESIVHLDLGVKKTKSQYLVL